MPFIGTAPMWCRKEFRNRASNSGLAPDQSAKVTIAEWHRPNEKQSMEVHKGAIFHTYRQVKRQVCNAKSCLSFLQLILVPRTLSKSRGQDASVTLTPRRSHRRGIIHSDQTYGTSANADRIYLACAAPISRFRKERGLAATEHCQEAVLTYFRYRFRRLIWPRLVA